MQCDQRLGLAIFPDASFGAQALRKAALAFRCRYSFARLELIALASIPLPASAARSSSP